MTAFETANQITQIFVYRGFIIKKTVENIFLGVGGVKKKNMSEFRDDKFWQNVQFKAISLDADFSDMDLTMDGTFDQAIEGRSCFKLIAMGSLR